MKKYFTLLLFALTIFKTSGQNGFSKIFDFGCVRPSVLINSFEKGFITGDNGIMKVDSVGNIMWSKSAPISIDAMAPTADSCYLAIGQISINIVNVFKFDMNGDTIWSKAMSFAEITDASTLSVTSDSSILITGLQAVSNGTALTQMFVLKLDKNGSFMWMKTFRSANYENVLLGIKEGPDQNYYAWGYISYDSTNIYYNAALICLSPAGSMIWNRTFKDVNTTYIQMIDIEFLDSGILCHLLNGQSSTLMKLDTDGFSLWSKEYGFFSGSYNFQNSKDFFKIRNNDYYLFSKTSNLLFEIDTMGNIIKSYETLWGVPGENFALTVDGQFAYTAYGFSGPGIVRYDSTTFNSCIFVSTGPVVFNDTLLTDSVIYTIGTDGTPVNYSIQLIPCSTSFWDNCPDVESIEQIPSEESVTLFPNPASDMVYIKYQDQLIPDQIEIMDVTGQLVKTYFSDNSLSSIDISGLSNGVYLMRFNFEKVFVVKKICIQGN
jgi:hypothetical protein